MAPFTPARALLLLTSGLTCLLTAAAALIGALVGGGLVALAAAAGTAVVALTCSFWARRRAMTHFAAAHRQAGVRGYAEGIAHGVLLHVTVYESAVFPRSGPAGVTPEERLARRTIAYRMAALEEVPRSVREAAADALAALDEADRARAEEALTHLAGTVRREYARP
jgi:hypothetical protein